MEQRLNLITLGVADVPKSRAFYERLGWKASSVSVESTVFFQAGGVVLSLFGRADLAKDAGVGDAGSGFRATTLAYNARSREDADRTYAELVAAGASPVKPLQTAEWGGYSGYVADPDGHLIEVAHNPFFPLDEAGLIKLPD